MKKTDFSMQSFWAACIASALCHLGFETGLVGVQENGARGIISVLVSILVGFGYWWYQLSKVMEKPSFDGNDVLSIILGSFMAQWAGVAIIFLSMLLGAGVEPVDKTDMNVPLFYKNCDEARVYGAIPVYEEDPGYHPGLDRDGDGVGCEPWSWD